jgi:serine/threonine-protein kinase
MPAKVILEVLSGPIQGQVFSFDRHDTFLFGRHKDCHARILNDVQVSRHHFLLEVNPPSARVRDLGSLNGTFVNGVKCGGRAKGDRPEDAAGRAFPEVDLKHGDQISVGGTTIAVKVELPRLCVQCGMEISATKGEIETSADPQHPHPGPLPSREREKSGAVPDGFPSTGAQVPITVTEAAPGISNDMICEECRSKPAGLRALLQAAAKKPPKTSPLNDAGYDLGEVLGIGGMGVVHKALRRSDGQAVAVKLMLAKVVVSEKARDAFLREIDVVRKLEHRNIVKIFETGPAGEGFYFAMELCNAGSLDRMIARQGGKLRPGIAAPIILQCLHGLEHAHRQNFVHRDLKPQNVLLDKQEGRWCVKIADFGLAKDFAQAGFSGMTATGSYGGTYNYMPREQLTHFKYVRPVSDVWSIAATFYHMLTGAYPLDFSNDCDPVAVILNDKPVPIRKRDQTIPAALAAVIDRALSSDPAARYQTAVEMRTALETAIRSA